MEEPRERGLDPLLDEAPCGFVAFRDDGTVEVVNATLLRILGYTRGEVEGHSVEALLAIGSRIFYQTHFFPLLRLHGRAEEIFLLLRAKDGSDVAALANAVRRDRDGSPRTECVLLEVRERRKFEDALLRAKKAAEDAHERVEQQAEELQIQSEELEALNDELLERTHELEREREVADAANKAKSVFLAMMSHELRTPLNAIGGYVQLLEMGVHGEVTDAQRQTYERVLRAQRHLLRLINDVLNLAKVESGHVDYEIGPMSVREAFETVLPMIEPQLASRGITRVVDLPAELVALGDRDKVQQILLNLLSNATKFTPAGGRITISAVADPARDGVVCVEVADTGCGIPANRLQSVFDPFVQVESSPSSRREGTGLGLAISRDLARGMGGELTAESEVGVGSRFTLTLPRAQKA